MATQTYTQLAPGAPATFGTSGAAVSALQTQLNTQNAGVVRFGYGTEGNSNNNDICVMSVPYFAVEK